MLYNDALMHRHFRYALVMGALSSVLLTALGATRTSAQTALQAPAAALRVRVIAEVEVHSVKAGRPVVYLIPADRLVPGDRVVYTLEVRNVGAVAIDTPVITHRVPEHMRYLGDSAAGPGADVTYSVDGGLSYDRPENLTVTGHDGKTRLAVAADYSYIRWQLKNRLKANSVAFVRFRAQVE